MKTYKTGEVYNMALEKPQTKVKRLSDGKIYKLNNGKIEPEGEWDCFSTMRVSEEWTLVKEPPKPVDFTTAFNSGKQIKPVERALNYGSAVTWVSLFPRLELNTVIDLINGKWFIKEGEDNE